MSVYEYACVIYMNELCFVSVCVCVCACMCVHMLHEWFLTCTTFGDFAKGVRQTMKNEIIFRSCASFAVAAPLVPPLVVAEQRLWENVNGRFEIFAISWNR